MDTYFQLPPIQKREASSAHSCHITHLTVIALKRVRGAAFDAILCNCVIYLFTSGLPWSLLKLHK